MTPSTIKKKSLRLGFGTEENGFNKWVKDVICRYRFAHARKVQGTFRSSSHSDHYLLWKGQFGILENKFIHSVPEVSQRTAKTVLVGKGCSSKRKKWSAGQMENLENFWKASMYYKDACPLIGGLVGILGTTKRRDMILAVPWAVLGAGFYLTTEDIHDYYERFGDRRFAYLYLSKKNIITVAVSNFEAMMDGLMRNEFINARTSSVRS